MFIIVVFISFLYGNNLFADSEVRGKYRLRSDDGDIRNQYRLDFRYKHEFGSNSCVSLNVRLVTGDAFVSDYNTIGDNEKISLRNLYFDVKCLVDKSIQVGAIPADNLTPLDIKTAGWIDGMRIKINMGDILDEVSLTVGSLSPEEDLNAFERLNQEIEEYVRLTLKKKINEKLQVALGLTRFKSEETITAIATYSLEEFNPIIDEIKVYTALGKEQRYYSGIEVVKNINQYKIAIGHVDSNDHPFPGDNFYGKEKTYYISLSKRITDRLVFGIRAKKDSEENRLEATVEYRY